MKKLPATAAERAFHLQAWQKSGLSRRAYGKQAGISASTLSYWLRHRSAGTLPDFLSVSVAESMPGRPSAPVPQVDASVAIELANRRVLRLSGRADLVWLAELLQMLESLPCG